MNRYKITYPNYTRDITTTRKAENAEDAIEKLCDQYGWRCKTGMVDADTRGKGWAVCFADTEGGINFRIRIEAHLAEAANG